MSGAREDIIRATDAAHLIIGDRDIATAQASIMVTAEHAVATVLLALYPDARKAAAMLNEGLVPGVEARLALHASRKGRR